jgi:phosphatidylserine/phosphatidylglycerophosphate/cardiolipin synthase-like enzyme
MRIALIAAFAAFGMFVAVESPRAADVEIHYAPVENLERIDLDLLRKAERSIDFAAFILTNRVIAEALAEARGRGVKVRVLIDGSQDHAYDRLAAIADVVHVKEDKPIMHLKSYLVDGGLLRTGSANFSASGLKRQDNDLVLSRDRDMVRRFKERFEDMYRRAGPLRPR